MPPEFDKLPVPQSTVQENEDQSDDIKELIIIKKLSQTELDESDNLDKSFELIFKKYNNSEIENLPQIKDMVYGAVRDLGKSYFYLNKLVKNKIENKCLESLLHIVFFQISHERSSLIVIRILFYYTDHVSMQQLYLFQLAVSLPGKWV